MSILISCGYSRGLSFHTVEIKLPKPLFQGTPKNIKPAPTLEKYVDKPRAPFLAPAGVKNLAFEKKVTSSDSQPIIGDLNMVTDGDKEGSDGSYVELAPGTQWVQIDLGTPAKIYAFVVWHYHGEGRVYHDVVVQVADDADFIENVQTVYNNDFDNSSGLGLGKDLEYIDEYRGRLIDAKNAKGAPVKGRYVRLYSKGSTSNDMNHYVEVEVLGMPAK
ncbi:MAG: discoidin domain-containing protein [Planctomycetota bacterium]|nr:discoidin domain-containing protein [Planctomycetota bacterium]